MTEFLAMCVILKYLNDLFPRCGTWSCFNMFAKPTFVFWLWARQIQYIHNPSNYDFLEPPDPLNMLEHIEFSFSIWEPVKMCWQHHALVHQTESCLCLGLKIFSPLVSNCIFYAFLTTFHSHVDIIWWRQWNYELCYFIHLSIKTQLSHHTIVQCPLCSFLSNTNRLKCIFKFTLEQATKTQKGRTCITLVFLQLWR
jgi:hypothetical protein